MKSNQINVVAATVFRDREEVGHIFETGTSRQVWSDVGQPDRPNRIDFDLALIHAVASANLHVGTCPYSDAASDGAAPHSLSEPLGEDHAASLRRSVQYRVDQVRRSSCLPNRFALSRGALDRISADGSSAWLGGVGVHRSS